MDIKVNKYTPQVLSVFVLFNVLISCAQKVGPTGAVECVGSEQSRIGSRLWLSIMHRNKTRVISPILFTSFKDRQQVITAVLPRSQLNAHCEFAPKPFYYYYI